MATDQELRTCINFTDPNGETWRLSSRYGSLARKTYVFDSLDDLEKTMTLTDGDERLNQLKGVPRFKGGE